jgi:hypothetical protein
LTLLFIKLSFFLLYLFIFAPSRGLRIAVWVGGVFCTVFYTAMVILSFVFYTPRDGETFAEHTSSVLATYEVKMSAPLAGIGTVLDFYILLLPIFGVWRLQVSPKRKVGIAAVFATGFL